MNSSPPPPVLCPHVPVCPQIHLCCGNHSLGSTDVSLSALSAVSVDLENKAATVEGAFVLRPPRRIKQTQPPLPADMRPTVGVAVTLRREEVTPQVDTLINLSLPVGSNINNSAVAVLTPARSPATLLTEHVKEMSASMSSTLEFVKCTD